MSDKLDLIWYIDPTRPQSGKVNASQVKKRPETVEFQTPKSESTRPKRSKAVKG